MDASIKVATVVSTVKADLEKKKKKIIEDNLPIPPPVKHVTKFKQKG